MEKWTYYKPDFKCDQINYEMLCYSPWAGHRNFAYDYIANIKPALVVELGTHYGSSFFAFLQAVEDGFSPDTQLYGVDAWSPVPGNDWTTKEYEIDIYKIFLNTLAAYDVKAYPIKKSFDQALIDFESKSIDLLHIDGTHTYEAVRHDYESWLPKLKDNAVVFFHDISKTSYLHKDSAPKFWEELKSQTQYTLEFDHCYGLGILCKSEKNFASLKEVDFDYYQGLNNRFDVENRDALRKNYFRLNSNEIFINFLQDQLDIWKNETEKHKKALIAAKQVALREAARNEGQQNYIKELEEKLNSKKSMFGRLADASFIGSRAGL